MRILITGGAGFQGSHIAQHLLNSGHEITVLNTYSEHALANIRTFKKHVSIVWGSITDTEIVDKTVRGQDVVIHTAARINVDESIQNPSSYVSVNVTGTANILEAVRKSGSRLIHASTCEVYGADSGAETNETSELRPHSPYAASKVGADRLCFAYHKTFDLPITIVRPCNIYGPRQKTGVGGAVIPIFVGNALELKPLIVFGTGEQQREYMHVKDLVMGYDLILKRSTWEGETFNVGSGDTPSIKEIANFISDKTGADIKYSKARLGEVRSFKLNNRKIQSLGFAPKIPFWDGLQEYIESRRTASI